MSVGIKAYGMRITGILLIITVIVVVLSIVSGRYEKYNDWAQNKLNFIHNNEKNEELYDIIVFGGDPEGVAAAVSAARAGAKVLLLSYEDGLGGLMTYGWLNSIDMNYNPAGSIITKGIFLEFYNKIGGDSFDVSEAKQVFTDLVNNEPNITYINSIGLIDVIVDNNVLKGVKVGVDGKETNFYGRRIIDASQDGDLMAKAKVPYTYGQEDMGVNNTKMAVTLVFKVNNVNWSELRKDIANRVKEGHKSDGINNVSAWGFGDIYKEYEAINANMRLRGLNIGKQTDGSILINALQIFGVDGLDAEAKERAKEKGAVEAKNIVEFLKQYLPSFNNATFGGVAPELYVRESRHIEGEYQLSVMDVLENRDFEDKIALGSYPLDVQATSNSNTGYVMGNPANYSVPMRSIVPLGLENAYIVGRSASFCSLAASSARVIPVGMCVAEAAAISSVYSIINDVSPRQILKNHDMIKQIQDLIIKQGGYLDVTKVKNPYENIWSYKDARKLITKGLIVIGYDNSIKFDSVGGSSEFVNLIINGATRSGYEFNHEQIGFITQYYSKDELKSDYIARVMLYLLKGINVSEDVAWDMAVSEGIISDEVLQRIGKGQVVTKDVMYNMVVYILETLIGKEMNV